MQTIGKMFEFEAAHILPNHPGKCSRLHGHSYKMEVVVKGEVNPETGFVVDFADLKDIVRPIVERFDHRMLNWFIQYPSAENIACHVAHELFGVLSKPPYVVNYAFERLCVKVIETDGCWSIWDSSDSRAIARFDEGKDDLQAGWRSPLVYGHPVDIPTAIYEQNRAYEYHLQGIVKHGAQLHQLILYRDSMGKPNAIFDELRSFGILPTSEQGSNEKAQQKKEGQETQEVEEELEEGRNE